MPFVSQAQRGKFYAMARRGEIDPAVVKEWENATPKGKLPRHVKDASLAGACAAMSRFNLRVAGEELRLMIPDRRFHGFDAAARAEAERGHVKRSSESPYGDRRSSEDLAQILRGLDDPTPVGQVAASKDPLDRTTNWGPPSNLAASDAGGRLGLGQPTGFGGI